MPWIVPFIPMIAGAAASLMGGMAASEKGKADAATAEEEAEQSLAAGNENAARQRRLVAYKQSSLRAAVGGQGTTMEGSPMEVYLENAKQGELEAQDELYAAGLKARAKRKAAANASAEGSAGMFGGILGGVTKLAPLLGKT